MRKFLSLPQEKQDNIITAAMTVFGDVGYKKAYISDIAAKAGVSKSLIFHYFGSKKGLYSYLVYYTGKIVMTEAQHERDTAGKDFFARALVTIKFRLSLKKRYPAMNTFIDSVFNENDDEVASDTERLLAIATDMHTGISLTPSEERQFKGGVSAPLVAHLAEKYAEGVLCSYDGSISVEDACEKVSACLKMLKDRL